MSQTSSFYKYSVAVLGFILWGGWAFYINSKVSLSSGITSGLAQGAFSFVGTFVVIYLLTLLFNYFNERLFKLFIPTLIMVATLIVLSVLVHSLVNTPELIKTIAPNLVVSALFCAFTTYKLSSGEIQE